MLFSIGYRGHKNSFIYGTVLLPAEDFCDHCGICQNQQYSVWITVSWMLPSKHPLILLHVFLHIRVSRFASHYLSDGGPTCLFTVNCFSNTSNVARICLRFSVTDTAFLCNLFVDRRFTPNTRNPKYLCFYQYTDRETLEREPRCGVA